MAIFFICLEKINTKWWWFLGDQRKFWERTERKEERNWEKSEDAKEFEKENCLKKNHKSKAEKEKRQKEKIIGENYKSKDL